MKPTLPKNNLIPNTIYTVNRNQFTRARLVRHLGNQYANFLFQVQPGGVVVLVKNSISLLILGFSFKTHQ